MDDKPRKWEEFKLHFLNAAQARYIASLKTGQLATFDLSWSCITAMPPFATYGELAAHREVIAIFKRMGVR